MNVKSNVMLLLGDYYKSINDLEECKKCYTEYIMSKKNKSFYIHKFKNMECGVIYDLGVSIKNKKNNKICIVCMNDNIHYKTPCCDQRIHYACYNKSLKCIFCKKQKRYQP